MRILAAFAVLLTLASAVPAGAATPAFEVVMTPAGCTLTLAGTSDEFRVDTLANGGVIVTLHGVVLQAEESHTIEGCLVGYRISQDANGTGSVIEIHPAGVEFGGVVRSGGRLQIRFEKVGEIGGSTAPGGGAGRLYTIGVGDALKITVFGQSDLTKEAKVAPDGTITYSLLGDLRAAGKTVPELQEELRAALAKDYIKNPQVSVEVQQYGSSFVYVTGPVKSPGRYPLEGGITLKDALALAGGLTSEAGYTITMARKSLGADGRERAAETTRYSRADIEAGRANMPLVSGDVVTVAEKDYFYIQGQVHRPGKFEIGPGITFLGAISVAEGFTDWANERKIELRRVVDGQPVKQVINWKDVVNQKAPDVSLTANDIIVVYKRAL